MKATEIKAALNEIVPAAYQQITDADFAAYVAGSFDNSPFYEAARAAAIDKFKATPRQAHKIAEETAKHVTLELKHRHTAAESEKQRAIDAQRKREAMEAKALENERRHAIALTTPEPEGAITIHVGDYLECGNYTEQHVATLRDFRLENIWDRCRELAATWKPNAILDLPEHLKGTVPAEQLEIESYPTSDKGTAIKVFARTVIGDPTSAEWITIEQFKPRTMWETGDDQLEVWFIPQATVISDPPTKPRQHVAKVKIGDLVHVVGFGTYRVVKHHDCWKDDGTNYSLELVSRTAEDVLRGLGWRREPSCGNWTRGGNGKTLDEALLESIPQMTRLEQAAICGPRQVNKGTHVAHVALSGREIFASDHVHPFAHLTVFCYEQGLGDCNCGSASDLKSALAIIEDYQQRLPRSCSGFRVYSNPCAGIADKSGELVYSDRRKGADFLLELQRDGKPVAYFADETELTRWIHRHHSYSLDHALKHEGYKIVDPRKRS